MIPEGAIKLNDKKKIHKNKISFYYTDYFNNISEDKQGISEVLLLLFIM